ncbi:MAG: restriction endonuclease [Actinomycetota bacterium]|nr:restriction endonuclease [Actinomycetota bacterium]
MEKLIQKEDGSQELFDTEKIKKSLLRAGADKKIAEYIIKKVENELKGELVKAKDVYRLALTYLKKKQPPVAIKYTLKKAMMDFGPTGFVFEKYIARVLKEYGYKTEIGKIVKGFCVEHEVDVVAEKNSEHYMFECKYHNRNETKSDVKTALYIYARFLDIKKASDENKTNYNFSKAWLATNTKCTSEAIKYAECVGLGIIAWHYPDDKNLEYYIENKKLYPVTILPGLKLKQKEALLDSDILTIKDLLGAKPGTIGNYINAGNEFIDRIFLEAETLYT